MLKEHNSTLAGNIDTLGCDHCLGLKNGQFDVVVGFTGPVDIIVDDNNCLCISSRDGDTEIKIKISKHKNADN